MLGEEDFQNIILKGGTYIDKTHYVHAILYRCGGHIKAFRPNGFGKTVFLTTIKCFYEGKSELFKNLDITRDLAKEEEKYEDEYKKLKLKYDKKRKAKVKEVGEEEVQKLIKGYRFSWPPRKVENPLRNEEHICKVILLDFSKFACEKIGDFKRSLRVKFDEIAMENKLPPFEKRIVI